MSDQALILVVEDSEDHVFLLRRALKKAGVVNPIKVAPSGEEAIAYLAGTGPYSDWAKCPLPSIALLDLKMPGIDGFGVLGWIQQQPSLKGLRVVVLSSSDLLQDIEQAYD